MAKYIMVVPSSAHPGQDEAYNTWYDEEHLADLCAIPGVISGRRYEAQAVSPNPQPANYLAVYEIETEDASAVLAELMRRAESGRIKVSPALDVSSAVIWLYKAR